MPQIFYDLATAFVGMLISQVGPPVPRGSRWHRSRNEDIYILNYICYIK